MATNLDDLLKQKEALDRMIQQMQSTARTDAIAQIRELMQDNGLMMRDITAAPATKTGKRAGSPVAPKYRDATTGATWSGRGLKPKWLVAALASGKSISDFTL